MAELLDISGIPNKSNDCVQRGITIANALVKLAGLGLMQACAFVGYCMKESSCDPTDYNKSEAAGTAKSSALGPNCGEGIMQWSFVDGKNKARASIGLGPGNYPGGIYKETNLDQQIQMMIKSDYVALAKKQGIQNAQTWEAAICCANIQGHGSGHSASAYKMANNNINSEAYVRACMSKYGSGRKDLQRAKKWGMQVYTAMGGKAGDYAGGSGMVGGGSADIKEFNIEPWEIKEDENGKYTEEPILLGIANHIHMGGSAGGAGTEGSMLEGGASGTFMYSGSWGSLTTFGQQVIANANTHTMMAGSHVGMKLTGQSHRLCTSGPQGWYNKAGLKWGWQWVRSGGVAVDCNLASVGFKKLWQGKMGYGNPPNYQPTDVVAIYTTKSAHQHGVMWTGTEWLSDYIQTKAMCGTNYASWETYSQLWRHPRCWSNPPVS